MAVPPAFDWQNGRSDVGSRAFAKFHPLLDVVRSGIARRCFEDVHEDEDVHEYEYEYESGSLPRWL